MNSLIVATRRVSPCFGNSKGNRRRHTSRRRRTRRTTTRQESRGNLRDDPADDAPHLIEERLIQRLLLVAGSNRRIRKVRQVRKGLRAQKLRDTHHSRRAFDDAPRPSHVKLVQSLEVGIRVKPNDAQNPTGGLYDRPA